MPDTAPIPDLFNLSGKVALVTGASRGIGEATARLLARHGAHVLVSARRAPGCEAVVETIRADGGRADALACHIGDPTLIEAAFATIARTHGRLDILVNNAATNPYYGPVEDTDLAAFQKTVDVNIRGYFLASALAVKLMKQASPAQPGGDGGAGGAGAIVNIASVNGVVPGLLQGIYSITKAAVIGMTKSFARECGPLGIRVNAVLPGLTDTKFAGALLEGDTFAAWQAKIPLGRPAQPNEIAGAVLYLVSPAASYTTGVALNVDGGYLVT